MIEIVRLRGGIPSDIPARLDAGVEGVARGSPEVRLREPRYHEGHEGSMKNDEGGDCKRKINGAITVNGNCMCWLLGVELAA